MESGEGSHLRPHILPPLGLSRGSNLPGKGTISNSDKSVRQRIGTPAPRKKSPIPDDLDLSNLNGKKGNPVIRVESCRTEETQKNKAPSEKALKPLAEGITGVGEVDFECRLVRRPQLAPIVNLSSVACRKGVTAEGDVNGKISKGQTTSDVMSVVPLAGRITLPRKYAPLKPIRRKDERLST